MFVDRYKVSGIRNLRERFQSTLPPINHRSLTKTVVGGASTCDIRGCGKVGVVPWFILKGQLKINVCNEHGSEYNHIIQKDNKENCII